MLRGPLVLLLLPVVLAAGEVEATPVLPAPEDQILLANLQLVQGRLEEVGSPELVGIRSVNGVLHIPRTLVKEVRPGLATRMAAIGDGDLAGLLTLARWCRANGYNLQALQLLDRAKSLDGFSIAEAGLYATLVDELQGPDAALPLYVWYRQQKGAEPRILERLQRLEAAGADTATLPGTPPWRMAPPPAQLAAGQPAEEPQPVLDGLEVRGWQAENPQWSNAVEAKLGTVEGSKGPFPGIKRALEVTFTGGDKDKASIKRAVNLIVDPSSSVLSFRAWNPSGKALQVAVAVKTGNWVFHESLGKVLPPTEGFIELRFDLRAAHFKSQASNWQPTGRVEGLDDVKELQILIYNRDQGGKVFLQGISFVSSEM